MPLEPGISSELCFRTVACVQELAARLFREKGLIQAEKSCCRWPLATYRADQTV